MLRLEQIENAQKIIYRHMQPSPQMSWPILNQKLQSEAIIKHENTNPTGAFKVRGGLVLMENLSKKPTINGVISATRGNHGQSLALAGQKFNIPVTIVVPHGNSEEKNAAMRAMGAKLIAHGADFEEARLHACKLANEQGLTPIAPYMEDLICGVATYHYELLSQNPDIDAYYLPIGMGSGICSAIMVRDLLGLKTKIYGVSAEGAPSMYNSFKAGEIQLSNYANSLADGIATRMVLPEVFEIVKSGAEDIILVSDDEIKQAIKLAWSATHQLLEGAGAASLAGAYKERTKNKGKKIAITFSGANIDQALFKQWILAA